MPPLGIMVEVPSVAIAPEPFADVAFFSIGSNDLTQYVMAAARDNGAVAALNSVAQPGRAAPDRARSRAFGEANGIPVSLCGDAGGDPAAIPALLEAGLRDLSVVPAQLAAGQGRHRRRIGLGSGDGRARKSAGNAAEEAIRAYKTILSRGASTSARPARGSGSPTRSGKHRSFVTQITSPAYSTPIPAKHLPPIFSVCHFSAAERDHFLAAYRMAHPGKAPAAGGLRKTRHLSLTVPDLGDDKQNAALDRAVNEFIQRITSMPARAADRIRSGGRTHEEIHQLPSTTS